MGAMAKRFFKLRRVVGVTQTANQPLYLSFNDNPSLSQDWVPISSLFQMYRVNGLKLTFIPAQNARELTGVNTAAFQPVYVVHDTNNTITSIPSEDTMLQYEGLRIKTLTKMWSVYFKMSRRLNPTATQTVSTDGYSSVTNPQSTQNLTVLIPNVSSAALGTLGRFVVTAYLTAKARN